MKGRKCAMLEERFCLGFYSKRDTVVFLEIDKNRNWRFWLQAERKKYRRPTKQVTYISDPSTWEQLSDWLKHRNVSIQDFSYVKQTNIVGYSVLMISYAFLLHGIDENLYYSLDILSRLAYKERKILFIYSKSRKS